MLIELTGSVGGNKVMIDVSSIRAIEAHDSGRCTFIFKGDYKFTPIEPYEEVRQILELAGVGIAS